MVSRSASGADVCSGGDAYHLWVFRSEIRFAALSVPVIESDVRNAYWLNASSASMPGDYQLILSLVETQKRTGGHAAVVDLRTPLDAWASQRVCRWHRVPLPVVASVKAGGDVSTSLKPVTVTVI